MIGSTQTHWVISGPPRSGKSVVLVERLRQGWQSGLDGERALTLVPDRREARRLNEAIGPPPPSASGRMRAMSYHSFAQDLIERWWPLVAQQFGVSATAPEFLPFDLAQFACLNEYRLNPGHLQRLTIREQRLIVQLLSNMNLSSGNGLTLEEGWARVAYGLGLAPDDDVIADGLRLTQAFRERCLTAGVLPEDVQVEAAGWLLAQPCVRADMLARFDLLAIDGLDEFVPLMAERFAALAGECKQGLVVSGDDGGLRWLLGASAESARRLCDSLVSGGRFRRLCLSRTFSESAVVQNRSAAWLAGAASGAHPATAASFAGWTLSASVSPVKMAGEVVATVARLLADGVPPNRIALLIPYIDTLVATEIERHCRQRAIPFRIDRRWRSLLDEPLARACLTALRCVNPTSTRHATLVEVADLLVALTGSNPIEAQPWAKVLWNGGTGTLRDVRRREDLPYDVKRLGWWAGKVCSSERGPAWQLESFAEVVLAPHQSQRRQNLVRASYALATDARRFSEAAPRLGLEEGHVKRFFDYVDSNVVAADTGADPPDDSVLLTTPYAFLSSGRVAAEQCWLDVASPSWWEPPLLLLTNPHALSGELTGRRAMFDDDDRIRGRILGRIVRNLAARCDGEIHAFASYYASDGNPLNGPLYDGLIEMQAVSR